MSHKKQKNVLHLRIIIAAVIGIFVLVLYVLVKHSTTKKKKPLPPLPVLPKISSSSIFQKSLPPIMEVETTTVSPIMETTTASPVYKFPPATLNPSMEPIEMVSYGAGTYTITSSSTNATIQSLLYKVVDGNYYYGSLGSGISSNTGLYSTTDGYYTGSVTTTDVNNINYNGEWVQISLPLRIYLKEVFLYRLWTGGQPFDVVLLGSNDNNNWVKLAETTSLSYVSYSNYYKATLSVNATPSYSFYRLVVQRTGQTTGTTFYGGNAFNLSEFEFYGTLA